MATSVSRLRDVGRVTLAVGTGGGEGVSLGCATSLTVTLDSEVLRARCGYAVSERYQGITGLSLEAVIETLNPFIDVHPGGFGTLTFEILGASGPTGLPFAGTGITGTVTGVLTNVTRRFVRNELSTGSYTFRGVSSEAAALPGITCPLTLADGVASTSSPGAPSDFIRDIREFKFDECITTALFCGEDAEITEATELIEDSCQGQLWPTYVGITGLNITVTATGKGVKHAFDCAAGGTTCLGRKGEIEIGVSVGSDTDCAAIVDDGRAIKVKRANVTSLTITATHGEIATISLTWTAHGTETEEAFAIIEGA